MDIKTEEERIEEVNRYRIEELLKGEKTPELKQVLKKWQETKAEFVRNEMIRKKKMIAKDIEVLLRNDIENNYVVSVLYTYDKKMDDEYIHLLWTDDRTETLLITGMSFEKILKNIIAAVYE